MPALVRHFPDNFSGLEAETVYRAANRVERSPIRVEADEVTYNLHIAMRFELERELFSGAPDGRPSCRRPGGRGRREILGIELADDTEGVLQDVHWGAGLVRLLPDVLPRQRDRRAALGARRGPSCPTSRTSSPPGSSAGLRDFLRERIYRHGGRMLPAELIEAATGGPLDPAPLLRHLRAKFGAVYGFSSWIEPSRDLQGLQLGVEVERVVAALAADAADPHAAERRGQVADEEGVDPDRPGADRAADPLGALGRAGADDRREPVGRRVGELDRLVLGGEGLPGEDRAEDLALDDLGVVGRGLDQRRLVPEARRGGRPADLRAAPAERRSRRRPRGRARRSPRPGRGGRDGSAARSSSRGRAGRRARAVDLGAEALHELVGDLVGDEQAGAGEADLAGVVVHLRARASAASSRSASAKTSSGPLPPSSPVNGTRFEAAARPIARAVSGEPVNEIRASVRARGERGADLSPIPWTTLKTPGGMPASAVRSASSEQESGDHSAGFSTTVQPAASAGAVFQVESMNGAFQGVITTAGPAGIRITRLRVPFELQVRSS